MTSRSFIRNTATRSRKKSAAATSRKQYYLETRGDVLLRNKEVFRTWKRMGLKYMFLGIEAIDDEGLKAHRKRITIKKNIEALECARDLRIHAAVNIIADPNWDRAALPGGARMGALGSGDRARNREYAVSGHRNMGDGIAQFHYARLPTF